MRKIMTHGQANVAWARAAKRAGKTSTAKALKILRAAAIRIGEPQSPEELREAVRGVHKYQAILAGRVLDKRKRRRNGAAAMLAGFNSSNPARARRTNPGPKGQAKTAHLARAMYRRERVARTGKRSGARYYTKALQLARAVGRRRAAHHAKQIRTNPKRKARTMAKRRRSAAQRAAFKRMLAGLHRFKSKFRRGKRRKSRPTTSRKRRSPMAKRRVKHRRRRNPRAVVMTNPRRRRRRSSTRSRRMNPRRRRRMFHRRRRNPGMGGGGIKTALKAVFMTGIPALAAGGVSGFIDSKFLSTKSAIVRILAKVGEAAAIAMLFRRRPAMAFAAMGGVLGSIGYEQGVSFAGGAIVGASPAAKAAGVAALVTEDPRAMGVLVESMRGMGLQLDNNVSLSGDNALPVGSYQDVNLS